MLKSLAEVSISGRQIGRLTHEIGQELREARDQQTQDWLHHRRKEPKIPIPQAVAVAVDGGRILTRVQGQGPGVHEHGWKEDKIACLHTLKGPTFEVDPQPEPPKCFCDAKYVDELVKEIKSHKGIKEEEVLPQLREILPTETSADLPVLPEMFTEEEDEQEPKVAWPPKRSERTCVATQEDSDAFGPMVATEAYARNCFEAPRQAFLGDGQACNWTIQRKWFKDFEAIADFVHPLSYLYVAATVVAKDVAERWQWYESWMTACWQGRVDEVITALIAWQQKLGPPQDGEKLPETDPRVLLEKTVTYLKHNQARMDYPRYRRQGLPVTSCAVESLIKEFNYRVKGTEKFWNHPDGAETILQMRAAVLSDDDPLRRHLTNRPGSCYRRPSSGLEDGKERKAA